MNVALVMVQSALVTVLLSVMSVYIRVLGE